MSAHWPVPAGLHVASARLPVEGELPSFGGATGWLNSLPLTTAGLRGNVVLASFWTYTCINWLRQLPYLRAWADKYGAQGLVVIGVHTPEFGFEHDWATSARRWRTCASITRSRPTTTTRSGARSGTTTGRRCTSPTRRAGSGITSSAKANTSSRKWSSSTCWPRLDRPVPAPAWSHPTRPGIEAPADWARLRSPENYTGYERTENFASPGGVVAGKPHTYIIPDGLRLNHWALAGDWTMGEQAITLERPAARSPAVSSPGTCTWSWGPRSRRPGPLSGPPGRAATRRRPRHRHRRARPGHRHVARGCYQLIRQHGPVTERTCRISFSWTLAPGLLVHVRLDHLSFRRTPRGAGARSQLLPGAAAGGAPRRGRWPGRHRLVAGRDVPALEPGPGRPTLAQRAQPLRGAQPGRQPALGAGHGAGHVSGSSPSRRAALRSIHSPSSGRSRRPAWPHFETSSRAPGSSPSAAVACSLVGGRYRYPAAVTVTRSARGTGRLKAARAAGPRRPGGSGRARGRTVHAAYAAQNRSGRAVR